MANIKITELTELTTVANPNNVLVPIVNNGTTTQKITLANLGAKVFPRYRDSLPPSNSIGVAGDKEGDMVFTNFYLYYCTSDFIGSPSKVWQRIAKDATNW